MNLLVNFCQIWHRAGATAHIVQIGLWPMRAKLQKQAPADSNTGCLCYQIGAQINLLFLSLYLIDEKKRWVQRHLLWQVLEHKTPFALCQTLHFYSLARWATPPLSILLYSSSKIQPRPSSRYCNSWSPLERQPLIRQPHFRPKFWQLLASTSEVWGSLLASDP